MRCTYGTYIRNNNRLLRCKSTGREGGNQTKTSSPSFTVHGDFYCEIWMSFSPFLFFCRKQENHPTSYTSTIFSRDSHKLYSHTIFLFFVPPIHLSLSILMYNKQLDIQSKHKCKTNKIGFRTESYSSNLSIILSVFFPVFSMLSVKALEMFFFFCLFFLPKIFVIVLQRPQKSARVIPQTVRLCQTLYVF